MKIDLTMQQKWKNLSPAQQRVLGVLAATDTVAKGAALADLARRSDDEVRGDKRVWGFALTVVNSLGVLPLVYFLRGRR